MNIYRIGKYVIIIDDDKIVIFIKEFKREPDQMGNVNQKPIPDLGDDAFS